MTTLNNNFLFLVIPLHAVQGLIAYYILHIVNILDASHSLTIACVPLSKRNHTWFCTVFLNTKFKTYQSTLVSHIYGISTWLTKLC